MLDGVPLDDSLTVGEALTIVDRDVTLSCLLADGTPFSFSLNTLSVQTDATLTVTLVPGTLLGDVNQDNVVDFFDISGFIAVLAAEEFQAEADIDENGVVDFFDIGPFIELLSGG